MDHGHKITYDYEPAPSRDLGYTSDTDGFPLAAPSRRRRGRFSECLGYTALFGAVVVIFVVIQGRLGNSRQPRDGNAVYSERASELYLQYARASFCTPKSLEKWSCGEMCQAAPVVPGTVHVLGPGKEFDVQGFVAAMPNRVDNRYFSGTELDAYGKSCIIAFRGSVDIENWEADASGWLREWPPPSRKQTTKEWCKGCRVHSGFAEAYEELRSKLFAAIKAIGCRDVAVAGHSLGAAVATFAALEVRRAGYQAEQVFLFGAPRVGNEAFVTTFVSEAQRQAVKPPAWRVVHYMDPVPRLAPRMQPFGYRHIPREVYYPTEASDSYLLCDAKVGEDPACAAKIPLSECILSLDHVRYLNMTLMHKYFPSECVSDGDSSSFFANGSSFFGVA